MMTSNVSPLLADDQGTDVPNLGGGFPPDDGQSMLEQLIAKSSSEQAAAAAMAVAAAERGGGGGGTGPFHLEGNWSISAGNQNYRQPPPPPTVAQRMGSYFATLTAVCLCFVQTGLIWASFLSKTWFETVLVASVDWQKQYLSFMGTSFDGVLNTTNLASLLSTFIGTDEHWAAIILLIASLVIPCLSMILCVAWTVGDHQDRFDARKIVLGSSLTSCRFPRRIFEFILRISLLTVFTLMLMDVYLSAIAIDRNGTKLNVVDRAKDGLICYALGICCALAIISVLRSADMSSKARLQQQTQSTSTTDGIRVPPQRAFRIRWDESVVGQDDGHINVEEEEQHLQRPLLSETSTRRTVYGSSLSRRDVTRRLHPSFRYLNFCQKLFIFELGVGTILLWIPTFIFPLFEVHSDGIAATFMKEETFSMHFGELPGVMWQRGILAGTDHWMLVALGAVLVGSVYVLPLLATVLAISAWTMNETGRSISRNLLSIIHPCLCGIVFVLSLELSILTIEPVASMLLEEDTNGLCDKFHQITDGDCFTLQCHQRQGFWYLTAQSITLELFVLYTLYLQG